MIRDVRKQIVKWANYGVQQADDAFSAHRPDPYEYEEIRPFVLSKSFLNGRPKLPWIGDCSAYIIQCYWLANARDPSGENYSGYGNSDSLFAHGVHIGIDEVQPGDAVVFGPGGSVHAAVIVSDGPNPLTASFGRPGTPEHVTVGAMTGLGIVTYLRFSTKNRRLPFK